MAALEIGPAKVGTPPLRRESANTAAPISGPRREQKLIAVVVDVVVMVGLIAAGALLGEWLAGKSTRDVWRDAGSSVTVPSIELLMWLAPPVLLVLVYTLLVSRGQSLGARLRKSE